MKYKSYPKHKPSGIQWLGDIPSHWEVKKVKYVANSVLGKMLCNEDKGNYLQKNYLKSKNIQWLNVNIESVETMWFSANEIETYRVKKDDLLVSEGGEVGKTCIWQDELDECYIQNSVHKITFSKYNSKYYLYYFFTLGRFGYFESIVNQVSIGHLTKDKLININIPLPPLAEQHAIVAHIEKEMERIDYVIQQTEKEMELMKEYKQALISEAVTGKIRVE